MILGHLVPEGDLWRDRAYRRLWASVLTGGFAEQVLVLALPLAAAVLLKASPTQMGWLTALELLPYVLLSLPAGVWLDRVRKLPVHVAGELVVAACAASITLAWALDVLTMTWLYAVGFAIGTANTVAGSAAQVVLTQVVPRERLVEAHAKNALANSAAEVAGPGIAGLLVKALGAPLTMLVNSVLLVGSAWILRGLRVHEPLPPRTGARFGGELAAGLRFCVRHPLLRLLAVLMGGWQMAHYAAVVVQILFATRTLGLSEQTVGLCYIGTGVGTIAGSVIGRRLSQRAGPGPCLVVGYTVTALAWLLLAAAPEGRWGAPSFATALVLFAAGAVLVFINFLALRQAVTPPPLLGRMTATMRWLTLLAAGPGALAGGWFGEHLGLRAALLFAGASALVLAALAWRLPAIRGLRRLPDADDPGDDGEAVAADSAARPSVLPAPAPAAERPSGPFSLPSRPPARNGPRRR